MLVNNNQSLREMGSAIIKWKSVVARVLQLYIDINSLVKVKVFRTRKLFFTRLIHTKYQNKPKLLDLCIN